ncbi:vitamin B12-dependent ribonucleotide reductase [Clostridia bacterium]|nr:vitamin B12-dependent ribonucleotide reductase [Clostridia bacterium]
MLEDCIKRFYTAELENTDKTVYDLFKWKSVDVLLKNYSTGDVITDMTNLEFPEDYSQSACDIIAGKYFRKKGVPNERGYEYSMRQITHRMVGFWCESLFDEGLVSASNKQIVYDELAYMMLAQIFAPNSPQWFNSGLKFAYGITGSAQGHYYYDEGAGEVLPAKDAYTRTQGSACFIISIRDALIGDKSLTDQLTVETLLFKYGSGVGTNWSPIRSKDENLSGGGKSSGLLSFLKVSDRNAGAIKSGGTTRRAAKMNILDLDHPEILDYINWKSREEDKVLALSKMGYSVGIDGDAYETVSGQNANNSVRIKNSFMAQIGKAGATFSTVNRTNGAINKNLQISDIWEQTAKAAWRCGDPGVQFDDIINAWHTCPGGENGDVNDTRNRINASNPCSEYMFLDDTACNLASINILKFYKDGEFDTQGYLHTINLVQLVLEATIHFGQFPTKDIARKSWLFRTTGLGLTNLGTLFMVLGLPYDSDKARNLAAALVSIMTGESYRVSALMAEKIGAFAKFGVNRDYMLSVIKNHGIVAGAFSEPLQNIPYEPIYVNHSVLSDLGMSDISDTLKTAWADALCFGEAHGYRNAQVSVLAPTGTIAFAMDCATTSSEPFFSHITYKKLVGGGFMEIVNPALSDGLAKLGYNNGQIKDILKYVMETTKGKIEGAPHITDAHLAVFDTANKCGDGKRYISPEGHVKMMGALAPHLSGAISKTVNLPADASVDDVKDIYYMSWRMGVKAIALYRDGCKSCQPLSSASDDSSARPLTDYTYDELIQYIHSQKSTGKPRRVKPSGIRTARVHEACLDGLKLYITTSFYEDGRLGEVYVSSGRQGSLTKGLLDSLSTTISEMLQYGVPPQDIANMYRGHRYEPAGFITGHPYIKHIDSISDLISKIIDIELGNYEHCQVKPEGYVSSTRENKSFKAGDYIYGELCPTCRSAKLVKNGTCKVCTECGTTTGCS